MLSILIPVYNFYVFDLVYMLHRQATETGAEFEIKIIDDASDVKFRIKNQELRELSKVSYTQLEKNVGRARIRNQLVREANFKWLLFLDCDSEIQHPDFIKRYLESCNGECVVCGGRNYENTKPSDHQYYLHWLYGKKREVQPAEVRNLEPNRSFMTNNFMISRSIFERIQFNEKITDYGHEDTLFGYDLQKNKIRIKHIQNPVVHIGLETNTEFLEKTKEGLRNLKVILKDNGNEKKLIRDIKILGYYKFFKKTRLIHLVKFMFRITEPVLYKKLMGKHPRLFFFDLYKLGYLCSL
ncbi:MAG: glycosyltransferase [Bacteroidales bacterium]|nr:glycosyltransferase [Bacteroidales bacterium]